MSIFATRLKELRGTESQASFATAIDLNRVQYAKYESGANSPSVEVLERICRVHACSADWLLGLNDRNDLTAAKPPPSTINLEELRATATQLAEESVALSGTIKKLKKML